MPFTKKTPPDNQVFTAKQWAELDQLRNAERARRSFRVFMKYVYSVLEPSLNYQESYLGAALCEHLEAIVKGDIKRLLVSAPPQFGKSNIASVGLCLYDWIDNPERRYLNTSFKMSLAEHFSEDTAKVFNSDWYQSSFAKPRKVHLTKETIEVLENSRLGSRRATAFESATGFSAAGGVLICDDPHPVAVSDDERIKQIDHFNKGLSNRVGATGAIVVLGQRVHTDDLIGRLIEMGGYEHLCLPNEFDPRRSKVTSIGWRDPRDTGNPKEDEGKLLWPEIFNQEKTEHAKRYGRTHYEGQYNCQPVRKGGNIFNRDDFQYYTIDSLPKSFDQTIITLDCSFKDTKGSDFACGQVWGTVNGQFYCLDMFHEQADFTKTLTLFINLCFKWPQAKGRYVEEGANGHAILAVLKNKISGILPIKVRNESKLSRFNAIAPLVAAHNVYLPKYATWLDDYLLEMESVPNSRHDDFADATAMALTKLEQTVPFTGFIGTAAEPLHKYFL